MATVGRVAAYQNLTVSAAESSGFGVSFSALCGKRTERLVECLVHLFSLTQLFQRSTVIKPPASLFIFREKTKGSYAAAVCHVFFLYFPERFVLTKCSNREFYLYLNLLYKEHCWKSSIDCCATRKKLFFCDFVWNIQWRIGTMCSNDESVWEDKENLGQLFQALKGALVGQWGTMKFCSYDS